MTDAAVSRPPGSGRFTPWRRPRRWLFALVAAVVLALMAFAMVTAAREQTPTTDEPVYVGAAVVYWQRHDLTINPEHPPLGKLIIGIGPELGGVHLDPAFAGVRAGDPDADQVDLGRHLLYRSGNDPWRVMLLARLPMIVLTLMFGLVVLGFARDLAGPAGGLLALALYAFSPDLIAHGSLATLDVPAVGFLLTSAWLLWRARGPSRRRVLLYLVLAGLALGAALATRMSALPAVPVLALLAVLSVRPAGRPAGRPAEPELRTCGRLRLLVVAGAAALGLVVIALGVVWASYLAVDPHLRWTPPPELPVVGGLRGFAVHWLPVPQAYRDGMRLQFGLEDQTFAGFLLGHRYHGSLWYYLPVALVIKTPLGMLVLWLAGAIALLAVPRLRASGPYALLLPAVLLAAALNQSRDFGVRYAIFVPVFGAVVAAAVAAVPWRPGRLALAARAVTAGLVLFVAVSSLRTFPYYLPYSNEAFGGPAKTYLRLHDSNVDWGQDLGRLAAHLRERYPGEKVWLVYKGGGVPSWYGIRSANPRQVPPGDVHGLLVVSDAAIDRANTQLQALIAGSRPIDQVGHSITIFRR